MNSRPLIDMLPALNGGVSRRLSMTRIVLATLLMLALAAPVWADPRPPTSLAHQGEEG